MLAKPGDQKLRRYWWYWFAALLLSLAFFLSSCSEQQAIEPPRLAIPVLELVAQEVEVPFETVGQTTGSSDIPIRARVTGVLEAVHFREGRRVTKDQLLYEIEQDELMAKVVEYRARQAQAQTMLVKARSDLRRIRPLAEMKAVSQVDLDTAVANFDAARQEVEATTALVEQAEIELSYTRIHAPLTGRIGISEAKIGEFVGSPPNPVVLNYISKINPIRVVFHIDEKQYLELAPSLLAYDDKAGADGQPIPNLHLILANNEVHPEMGWIVNFDAAIDPSTGRFTFEADFPNPGGLVLAGQFARIRGVKELRQNAIVVPERAVRELQNNFSVVIINSEDKVEFRPVTLGPHTGEAWIIESGLAAGERIALDGLNRLQEGMTVQVLPPESAESQNKPGGEQGRPQSEPQSEAGDSRG